MAAEPIDLILKRRDQAVQLVVGSSNFVALVGEQPLLSPVLVLQRADLRCALLLQPNARQLRLRRGGGRSLLSLPPVDRRSFERRIRLGELCLERCHRRRRALALSRRRVRRTPARLGSGCSSGGGFALPPQRLLLAALSRSDCDHCIVTLDAQGLAHAHLRPQSPQALPLRVSLRLRHPARPFAVASKLTSSKAPARRRPTP
eukprot:scaffold3202_cov117-Isochrysis_galbana.AAC.11